MSSRSACVLLAIIATALPAGANPSARRKTRPDQVTQAASETFMKAVEADEKGDLRSALGLYQKAFEIAPHASTIYNIADLERRLGRITDAIHSYETYLALAPRARDRAEIEVLVSKLAKTPGTLLVTTHDPSSPRAMDLERAYILVDGEILAKPGTVPGLVSGSSRPAIALEVAGGEHVVDVVTSIAYGVQTCKVRPGERAQCIVNAPPRAEGFVVISGTDPSLGVLLEPKGKTKLRQRIELPPGRARLLVRDRWFECPPVVVDVPPRGGVVTYLFAGTREFEKVERCRKVAAKRHRLRFD